jgi:hypothetical protein
MFGRTGLVMLICRKECFDVVSIFTAVNRLSLDLVSHIFDPNGSE